MHMGCCGIVKYITHMVAIFVLFFVTFMPITPLVFVMVTSDCINVSVMFKSTCVTVTQ